MPVEVADIPFETPKATEQFRNYADSDRQEIVTNHYRMMRQNQTVEFVRKMNKKYSFETPRAILTIEEVMKKLEGYVDSSDPDLRSVKFIIVVK
mmetsp:Transcript_20120/g.21865  ORF Transcript_20120/g.21865 Transcript_20120/m.21865 type:complete len:94 (-) Transcript_20120:1227-1508(-)